MKKLLTIFTISALILTTLVGCGKTSEKSETSNEPTVVAEQPTEKVELTETVELTEAPEKLDTPDLRSEENPESGEVDLTGYLADYPLTAGDKEVYIAENADLNFFADADMYTNYTYADYAKDCNTLALFTTAEPNIFGANVQYSVNPEKTISWYKTNTSYEDANGNTINVTVEENTTYTNTIYTISQAYPYDYVDVTYIVEYEVDDVVVDVIFYNVAQFTDDEINTLFEYFGNTVPVLVK